MSFTVVAEFASALRFLIPARAVLNVNAAENEIRPYASNYLTAYNTYICDVGNGRHEIWFEVMGTGDMDEIGTLSIELYEVTSTGSLKWVKTFLYEDYNNMWPHENSYH